MVKQQLAVKRRLGCPSASIFCCLTIKKLGTAGMQQPTPSLLSLPFKEPVLKHRLIC